MIKFGPHLQILSIIIKLISTLIYFEEVEKMSDVFQRHRDKRISEIRERIHNSRIKKKEKKVTIFSQHANKAQKNVNE